MQDDNTLNDLININSLKYEMSSDMSVCSQRRYTKHFFTNQTYSSSNPNMTVILQTGSSFVDNAFLHFKVAVQSTGPTDSVVTLKSGVDILQSMVGFSRDWTEVFRTTDMNLYIRSIGPFESCTDKEDRYNNLYRKPRTFVGSSMVEYSIPLAAINGLFATSTTRLLPSVLMAGFRMEFHLAPPTAFQCSAGSVLTYTVSDVYVNLRENILSDAVLLAVNSESSTHGLEIPFKSVYTSTFDTVSNRADLDVRKAVSRALTLFTVPRIAANIGSPLADSFAPEPLAITSVQTRLGSVFMPSSVCTSTQEMYIYTTDCFDHPYNSGPSVSPDLYLTLHSIYGQDLERAAVQMSGSSINNSRTVSTSLQFSTALAGGRNITCFLEYISVIRIFANNTVLEQ